MTKTHVVYTGEEARAIWKSTGIRQHRGWHGAFTKRRAPGALACGSAVVKRNSDPGDQVPDGTVGKVLGSILPGGADDFLYFVEWSTKPRHAVAIVAFKVQAANILTR